MAQGDRDPGSDGAPTGEGGTPLAETPAASAARDEDGHTIVPAGMVLGFTYRIEKLLARGGMGEVYRAIHLDLRTEHAIKVIRPELANDAKVAELFKREATTLRAIRNDAIVAYDGIFRDENGRLYLVMEYVDGPSLSEVLKARPLSLDELYRLRERLAKGLAAAHAKGIVHRDLSPDNVILPGGELDKAKIIDFGIAKLSDPLAGTIVGDDFAGRYLFASPEQFGMFGARVDARSDIYSLGLVLAAAAAGKPLAMGSTPMLAIDSRRAVPDLSPVPEAFRAELARMLEPDPERRMRSLDELTAPEPPAGAAEGSTVVLGGSSRASAPRHRRNRAAAQHRRGAAPSSSSRSWRRPSASPCSPAGSSST